MQRLCHALGLAALLLLGVACGGRGTLGAPGDGGADGAWGDGAADGNAGDAAPADAFAPVDGLAPGDALVPLDAAGADAGGTYGITCGHGLCTPGTQLCCVTGSAPVEQCIDKNTVGPHCDFGANCDGPEDCAGGSCCAPSGALMQTYCASGACPAGRTLCHGPADCPGAGELCCLSLEFGWEHSECMPGPQCPS